MEPKQPAIIALKLPTSVVGPQDLLHLEREADRLVEELLQARVAKEQAGAERSISRPGVRLSDLFKVNGLEFDEQTLPQVSRQLHQLRTQAPRVRLSLAGEPGDDSMSKVVEWFRKEVHPQVLVQLGVQPAIAAGCVLHTSKRRYDWAIRTKLNRSTTAFAKVMKEISS